MTYSIFKGMKFSHTLVLLFALILVSFLAISAKQEDAAGDIRIVVTNELGAVLPGATVTGICTGHSVFSFLAVTDALGAATFTAAGASGCVTGNVVTFTASETGYVTKTASDGTYTFTNNPDSHTLSGVQFSVKVAPTEESDGAALTGANSVTAGSGPTTCPDLETIIIARCR